MSPSLYNTHVVIPETILALNVLNSKYNVEFLRMTIPTAQRGRRRLRKQAVTLHEFIEEEMSRRGMGVNEFARLCGVGHSMISKYVKPKGPTPTPTVKFLRSLSKGTGVPLSVVLAIAFPEIREETKIDPVAELIARRIMKFRDKTRDMLIGILESLEKGSNNH
jgi:transcriptional regulator with XRE-family HTH domain